MKLVTLILLFIVSTSYAQRITLHNNQQWMQYYTQTALGKDLVLYADGGIRRIDEFSSWSQHLLRAGIGYPLTGNIQGVTGLALFRFFQEDVKSRKEFRVWQEFNHPQHVGRTWLQQRLRIEARYFRNLPGSLFSDEKNFNIRFRYRLQTQTPVLPLSKKHPERMLLLTFGDEVFINAGKEIVHNFFDNNRLLIGPSLQFSKDLSIGVLYNHQFGQRNRPATVESSEILWLTVNQRFGKHRNAP